MRCRNWVSSGARSWAPRTATMALRRLVQYARNYRKQKQLFKQLARHVTTTIKLARAYGARARPCAFTDKNT